MNFGKFCCPLYKTSPPVCLLLIQLDNNKSKFLQNEHSCDRQNFRQNKVRRKRVQVAGFYKKVLSRCSQLIWRVRCIFEQSINEESYFSKPFFHEHIPGKIHKVSRKATSVSSSIVALSVGCRYLLQNALRYGNASRVRSHQVA